MRYFFEITYKGTHYHGWQKQTNAEGIQQLVEKALSKIFRSAIEIVGSGRTDTGVHCKQQFFHADLEEVYDENSWLIKCNSLLPFDIAIRTIKPVKHNAHARFDVLKRSYQYVITRVKDPFLTGLAYQYYKLVDISLMNQVAKKLIGKKNFQCFSKVNTDTSHFICEITRAQWSKKGDLLVFDITANRFLRGMVRAIVGTLLNVGTGKIAVSEFEMILASKDRKKAGMNVPPQGLYLTKVKYPKKIYEHR